MSSINDHQYATVGLDPIAGDNPCGENARYEPVFEELEAELAKQESLTAETVDWNRVAQQSATILKTTSKDLLVGSYLCNALLIKEKYAGLAVGIKILKDMVENHWDCLFPPAKRMRARQTAISWLAEKAGGMVAETIPTAAESQSVIEAADLLKELDNLLVEKMGDQAPMLSDLSRPLKNYKQSAQAEMEKASAPPPAAPAAETAPPVAGEAQSAEAGQPAPAVAPAPAPAPRPARAASAAAPAVVGDIESDADAKKMMRAMQDMSRTVSGFWIGAKLSDARAYRMSRVATWMVVEVAPPANDGVTQIMPPPAERIKFLDGQIEKAEYSSVLPELEKTVSKTPFWLDGQYKVVTVLKAMGGEYENAAKTVIRETRNFLERIPEVLDLSFSDQTPFVGDQTRMWIDSEVLVASGGESSSSSSGSGGGEADEWDTVLAEAKKKATSGEMDAAVKMFNEGINSASQVRDQFYWRCALADLFLQTGNAVAASGVLEQVSAQAEEYRLTEWEPRLLAKIYNLLYQSYQKQQNKKKDDADLNKKTVSAYEKLCWFDPVTALSLKGG